MCTAKIFSHHVINDGDGGKEWVGCGYAVEDIRKLFIFIKEDKRKCLTVYLVSLSFSFSLKERY
jgi:hypothetical protein